jgi:hypothetical protein
MATDCTPQLRFKFDRRVVARGTGASVARSSTTSWSWSDSESSGYADCNDAAWLPHDAVHKVLLDRTRSAVPRWHREPPLVVGINFDASVALSRFENC